MLFPATWLSAPILLWFFTETFSFRPCCRKPVQLDRAEIHFCARVVSRERKSQDNKSVMWVRVGQASLAFQPRWKRDVTALQLRCSHKLTPEPKHRTCTCPYSEKQLKMHPEIPFLPSAAGPLGRQSSFRHYQLVWSLERAVAFACLHWGSSAVVLQVLPVKLGLPSPCREAGLLLPSLSIPQLLHNDCLLLHSWTLLVRATNWHMRKKLYLHQTLSPISHPILMQLPRIAQVGN